MTSTQFDCAILCLRAWQAAKSDNIDELLAVACTLRNRVHTWSKTYLQVCEEAVVNRPYPNLRHAAMIHPTSGLLAAIEGIYKNETPDMTSNHLRPHGALYFGRAVDHHNTGDWFDVHILKDPEAHGLIGSFGVQQFYE